MKINIDKISKITDSIFTALTSLALFSIIPLVMLVTDNIGFIVTSVIIVPLLTAYYIINKKMSDNVISNINKEDCE